MNATLKGFLAGATGILALLGGVLAAIFLRRPRSPVDDITSRADAQVDRTRAEIKNDSDQALAARFNRLAKKEKKE